MPLPGKKKKPSRRTVRGRKEDEQSALEELVRRVVDEAPAHASVSCPAREFAQLPLSDNTMAGLSKAGFSHMTEIQRTSIPHALAGRDLQGGARTGSGKTLAFLVPMLECLYRARWSRMDGIGGLVISPTRELVRCTPPYTFARAHALALWQIAHSLIMHTGFAAGLANIRCAPRGRQQPHLFSWLGHRRQRRPERAGAD